jgi:hypothetical protein
VVEAIRRRWAFVEQVTPSGVKPLMAIVGAATILVPGSLLGIFLDNFWLGAAVVIAFGALAMTEGTYRLWSQTHEALAQAEGTEKMPLPDRIRQLHEEGLAQRQSIDADSTWGTIHRQTPYGDWVDEVNRTLRHDAPQFAVWVHQMESPAPRLSSPAGDPKGMQIAAYDWQLDRLVEVEAMLRADEPDGHPDGPSHTEKWNRLERAITLFQENLLLQQQTVPFMGMNPQMELHEASIAITAHVARAEALLAEVRGTDGANKLLEAEIPPRQTALRDGLDVPEVHRFEASQVALREVLRIGEVAS